MKINEEILIKLTVRACDYLGSLGDHVSDELKAGQALGIKVVLKWLKELENENK